jgi:hypothetical protein
MDVEFSLLSYQLLYPSQRENAPMGRFPAFFGLSNPIK